MSVAQHFMTTATRDAHAVRTGRQPVICPNMQSTGEERMAADWWDLGSSSGILAPGVSSAPRLLFGTVDYGPPNRTRKKDNLATTGTRTLVVPARNLECLVGAALSVDQQSCFQPGVCCPGP